MTELDDRLTRLRAIAAEAIQDLRDRALRIDADPGNVTVHLDSPVIELIRRIATPPAFNPDPIRIDGRPLEGGTCLNVVVGLTELAYGDAASILALPGPALAGVVVRLLGDDEQQERFFRRIADGKTWAFCAITEPEVGNDATRMRTTLTAEPDGTRRLVGVKRYIGNGTRGDIGVVFARTGKGPLAIRAALLEAPFTGWSARALPMIGLRGARVSEIELSGLPVTEHMLLGRHLPPLQRGMWGAIRAFNDMRTQIAAMAVGTSLAVCDYVRAARTGWSKWEQAELDAAEAEIAAVRAMVYRTAAAVDADPDCTGLASAAKIEAVALAKRMTTRLPRLLGRGALLAHPLLEKWWRDASAFEFMEGTSNIQRLQVTRDHLAQRERPPRGRAA